MKSITTRLAKEVVAMVAGNIRSNVAEQGKNLHGNIIYTTKQQWNVYQSIPNNLHFIQIPIDTNFVQLQ